MFQIGQNVVYGSIGVCKIEAIGKLQFFNDSPRDYYTLRPFYTKSNDKIYVPVNADVPMRAVLTREEALSQIGVMKNIEPELYFARNQTLMAAHYQEMLLPHSVAQYMKLMKELCRKEVALKQKGKRLSGTDQHFYKLVEQLLSEEFALVLDETPTAAKEQLRRAALS